MVLLRDKDNQLEKESFQLKRTMLANQINKDSQRKEMTPEEEDLTREIKVGEGAERLSTSVTNVTRWVIDIFSVLRMITWDSEMRI